VQGKQKSLKTLHRPNASNHHSIHS